MNEFDGIKVNVIDKKIFKKKRFEKINDIIINGVKYKFKLLEKDVNGFWTLEYYYNSLIVKYMADMVGINCCDVSLGLLKGKFIVLMPDYQKESFNYISGKKILYDYLLFLEENKKVKEVLNIDVSYPINYEMKDWIISQMNNLEIIFDALIYRYRDDSKYVRQDKVSKIMNELAKRYSFEYLDMQNDRHNANWEIEENNTDANMAQLYDNGLSFNYREFVPEMKTDMNSSLNFETELERYLVYSSDYYKKQFIEIYDILSVEKFIQIIEKIEKEQNINFSPIYKNNIIQNYSKNYEDITKLLIKLNLIEGGLKHE